MATAPAPYRPAPRRRTPVVLSRPGAAERAYVVGTFFLLAYSLPTEWFTEPVPARVDPNAAVTANASTGALPTVIFTALFAFAVLQLLPNLHLVSDLIRRERMLPLFIGVTLLSTLWSLDPGVTARRSSAMALTAVFAYYLVIRFDLSEILRYAGLALAAGTILNLLFVFALPRYGTTPTAAIFGEDAGDWTGLLPEKNTLGMYSVLGVLTFLTLARSHRRYRVYYYPLALLNVWLVLGSNSKTALVSAVGLTVMLVVFIAFRARKTLFGAVAVTMTTAAVGSVLIVTLQLEWIAELLDRDVTLTGRTELWDLVIAEISANPVLGVGWSAFWNGWDSPSHEILVQQQWAPAHAHNAFLEYALQIGIFGAALFLALFSRSVVRATRHVQAHRGALGLWPLAFFSFTLMFSISESGFLRRNLPWALFVVAVLVVTRDTRQSQHDRVTSEIRSGGQPT